MMVHPRTHGFCPSCFHPEELCCCGRRECRKEAKELLVIAETAVGGKKPISTLHSEQLRMMEVFSQPLTADQSDLKAGAESTRATTETTFAAGSILSRVQTVGAMIGSGKTFIGGGCCVHLSVEYMPSAAGADAANAVLLVLVSDSEQTMLLWGKLVKPGTSYQVKESIISTKPGAMVQVVALNVTARLRWCEVFSC
jgi:hypothetical protein